MENMRNRSEETQNGWRKIFLAPAYVVALVVTVVACVLTAAQVRAQVPTAQSPAIPQWQTDAGGKMEFDVASVKQDTAEPSASTRNSNVPLGPQDAFTPTGGLLSATNWALLQYMVFAYKLAPSQLQSVRAQLPKWATNDRFDIEARASGNPTKDQFRLMMQALLAERFKLTIHYEARQLPLLALIFDKPVRSGPQLKQHPDDSLCSTAPARADSLAPTVAGGFPEPCGAITDVQPSAPGRLRVGARNIPMAMIADSLVFLGNMGNSGNLDRPILDKTGLTGKFDFVLEWTPQPDGPRPPGATFQPDPTGPTFLEALKEQLGLKLEPQTGPVDVIVVDHVQEPSPN
jgi:uncharacterized protein (TIGR03435 family)